MSVTLPNGGTPTTPLGFGTSYLAGGFEAAANRRLVDVAFDAGIRHFDTAPSYGMGLAEGVLGSALAGRRDQVTVTSKVGLSRPQVATHIRLARVLAKPLRRYLGRWTRQVGNRIYAANVTRGNFDRTFVERSFAETLQHLRMEHVDLLLLHEVRFDDINDELLTFLDKARAAGRCLAIGTATAREEGERIVAAHPGFFDVMQHSWSSLEDTDGLRAHPPLRITHRSVLRALEPLKSWFSEHPQAKHEIAVAADVDLDDQEGLPSLLLGAALAANPEGITLAASRRAERIMGNAQVLANPELVAAGGRLLQALAARTDKPAPHQG